MDKVNVLIGIPMPPALLEQIARIDPCVNLLNDPNATPAKPVSGSPPFAFQDDVKRLFPEMEVLFTSRVPHEILTDAKRLKWVQLMSAGAELVARDDMSKAPFKFTTAVGVHPVQISEWVMGAMLALAKEFPRAVRDQEAKNWRRYTAGELYEKTVGILGAGNIGRRVAHLSKAFGMRVIGVRRSVLEPIEGQDGVDLLLPPRDLSRVLKESDFLVLCLPGTKETAGMIGPDEIAKMKQGSYLLNIGRGSTVDEVALLKAIREGHLAGAALDVFDHEPLPPDNPIWSEPRILMTSHVSGNSPRYLERATALFMDNLRRYLDGRELLNVVDPARGY